MSVDLGDMIVSYKADISDLVSKEAQAKSSMSSVSDSAQSSGQGILGGFGSAISGAVNFGAQVGQTIMGIQGLASGAMGLANALLQPAATAETTQLSFETLLHSTKAAHQEMVDLNTFASGTPLQTQWVDEAGEKILAFGGKVGDVKPEITAIGDSLSGLGKLSEASLNSIVDIFGKISAQGKLTGGDMMQLSTWGIPAWQALSESMHKPIPELQKMVSAGLIPAAQALPALQQGMEQTFGGGMAKQANTFSGLMSTLASNWQIFMAAVAGPALKLAEGALGNIGGILSSPAFQTFGTTVGQGIANVFSQIGTFVSQDVVPAFQRLQPVITAFGAYFQSDQFQNIVADFQTLGNQIGIIAGDFSQASGAASPLVTGALASLPGVLNNILQAADNVIFPLGQFLIWMQGADPWTQVVKDGLIGIGVAFGTIKIAAFLETLPALLTGLAAWAVEQWAVAAAVIASTWELFAIAAVIAVVVAAIILTIQHWGDICKWVGGVFSALGTATRDAATGIKNGVGGAFDALGTKTREFATATKNDVGGAFDQLGTKTRDAATGIKNGVGNAFSALGTSVHTAGQRIVGAGQWMYDHNTYWKASADGIGGAFSALGTFMHTTATTTKNDVGSAFDWLGTHARDVATATKNDVGGAFDALGTHTREFATATKNTVGNAFSALGTVMHDKSTEAGNAVGSAWDKTRNATGSFLSAMGTKTREGWDAISGVFGNAWATYISGPITRFGTMIGGWFGNLAHMAFSWGANMIQGMIDGIGSMFSALGSAASNAAGQVAKFLGFHSPAAAGPGSELNVWGPNLVKGFASGIDASAPILLASVNHLMSVGTYPIKPSVSAVASSVSSLQGGGSGGTHTTVVELDGMQLAQVVQKHSDQYVRLKLGPRGRAA